MGRILTDRVSNSNEFKISAGVDIITDCKCDYPCYTSFEAVENDIKADVIIDYSSPGVLSSLLKYALSAKLPIILCATGYSPEQINEIKDASTLIPVFRSGNMSVGINLLTDLIKRACKVLGEDYDVEIIEKHHRRKIDAPSGTALMLADAAADALPYEPDYIYERESRREPRKSREIGISAVRGGTIVGSHEIIFAGQDEVIELKHTASSRDIFVTGTLKAADFIIGKEPAMYNMQDVLNN